MREALRNLLPNLNLGSKCEILSVSKGIEEPTLMMMHEVIEQVFEIRNQVSVLLGGNLAFDLACEDPMIADLASQKQESTDKIRELFTASSLEIYLFQNRRRLDIAGPVKNVHSVAAGICSVLYGNSTSAAIKARGLAELERIAYVIGFENKTQQQQIAEEANRTHQDGSGLRVIPSNGGIVSDYMLFEATRNFKAGRELATALKNRTTLKNAVANISKGKTIEGLSSAIPMRNLVKRLGIRAPIVETMAKILEEKIDLAEAAKILQKRDWRKS